MCVFSRTEVVLLDINPNKTERKTAESNVKKNLEKKEILCTSKTI